MNSPFIRTRAFVLLSILTMGCERTSSPSVEIPTEASYPKEETAVISGFNPAALGMIPPLLTKREQLDEHIGQLVALRGSVSNTKAATLLGVDIRPNGLRGQDCYAVGILTKWTTTQEQLDEAFNERGVFQTRGPGTTYTLYFDLSGELAAARKWPDESELEADSSDNIRVLQ